MREGNDSASKEQELEALKQDYEALTAKLKELSKEELEYVTGGRQERDEYLDFGMRTGGDIYIG